MADSDKGMFDRAGAQRIVRAVRRVERMPKNRVLPRRARKINPQLNSKGYIEGELTTALIIDEGATIDVGGGELVEILGNWFSADIGDRVGCVWAKQFSAYVAIVKRCPVDDTGDDPGTADGGDESGGGDNYDGGDETGGGDELDGGTA
jgi:hypothetical protein